MINLIAAIGLRGEIGHRGRIPWLDDPKLANVTKEDLGWFAKQTAGGVLVVGKRTYMEMLTMGFQPGSRDVRVWDGGYPPRVFLNDVENEFPYRDIWIAGGAHTYEKFMPFVQRLYISRIPWTGPADTLFPPIVPYGGFSGRW